MVMRWINVLAATSVVMLAISLFVYKSGTRELQRQAVQLESRVAAERDALAVLKAEWNHLTRPQRLERLARKYLRMTPARIGQYSDDIGVKGALARPAILESDVIQPNHAAPSND